MMFNEVTNKLYKPAGTQGAEYTGKSMSVQTVAHPGGK
jgi:hypothetical protein